LAVGTACAVVDIDTGDFVGIELIFTSFISLTAVVVDETLASDKATPPTWSPPFTVCVDVTVTFCVSCDAGIAGVSVVVGPFMTGFVDDGTDTTAVAAGESQQ